MGAENLAPTEIRSPDCPARSESLYRLSYRGPSTRRTHEKVRNLEQFLVARPQKKKLVPLSVAKSIILKMILWKWEVLRTGSTYDSMATFCDIKPFTVRKARDFLTNRMTLNNGKTKRQRCTEVTALHVYEVKPYIRHIGLNE